MPFNSKCTICKKECKVHCYGSDFICDDCIRDYLGFTEEEANDDRGIEEEEEGTIS